MKCNINKEEIHEGFQKAANIIPTRTGAAFLRTIWLDCKNEKLTIMSTDSSLEFTGTYPCQIDEEGFLGVPGRHFYDLFKKLPPGQIRLRDDPDTKTLLLEQGRRKYKIPTYDPSWFDNFTPFPESSFIAWSGEFLKELIDRTSFCIADEKEENMHYLKFSPLNDNQTIETCALNGFQFAMQRFKHQDMVSLLNGEEILIAKPYVLELKKWLTSQAINFTLNENRLFFANTAKNEQLSLPINFDTFPSYEVFLSYFDDQVSTMTIDKEELLDSLARISIFNTETERCSYFVFNDQELVIYSQAHDTGEATETIPIQFEGKLEKIIFPTRNVIDVLNHFNSQQLSFEFTSENGPCKISGTEDQNYVVIIMPVKIEEETYYTEENLEA